MKGNGVMGRERDGGEGERGYGKGREAPAFLVPPLAPLRAIRALRRCGLMPKYFDQSCSALSLSLTDKSTMAIFISTNITTAVSR